MANRSIKVAPKNLTEFQKQKFLEVQRYMKDHEVSKSKAMKACKASPTTYYPAERYYEKHGNLGETTDTTTAPKQKRKYTRRAGTKKRTPRRKTRTNNPTMKTIEVDTPVHTPQQMVALIGNPTDIMQSLKNLFS